MLHAVWRRGASAGPLPAVPTSTATEMTEPSTAESTRSRLTSQLELQTRVCWMEKKWRATFSPDFPPILVVYHINCHSDVENQALCVLPNWRESADQVFCREKCACPSVFIFVYTLHRWVKSKHCTRSFGFIFSLKYWLALSSGPWFNIKMSSY